MAWVRVGGEAGARPPLALGRGCLLGARGQTITTVILAKLGRDAKTNFLPGRRLGGALNPWRTSGSRVMGALQSRAWDERERSLPHIGWEAALLPRAGAQQGQREGTLQSLPGAWPRHCPKPWPPPSPALWAPTSPQWVGSPQPVSGGAAPAAALSPKEGLPFLPVVAPVLQQPPASRGGCSKSERPPQTSGRAHTLGGCEPTGCNGCSIAPGRAPVPFLPVVLCVLCNPLPGRPGVLL